MREGFARQREEELVIANTSVQALAKVQKAFEGVAEQLGIENEDDIQALIDEVRYGRKRE